jgi:hypothetical protein
MYEEMDINAMQAEWVSDFRNGVRPEGNRNV